MTATVKIFKLSPRTSIWTYSTRSNKGSFSSDHRGTQTEAIARATANLATGTTYNLIVSGKARGTFTI